MKIAVRSLAAAAFVLAGPAFAAPADPGVDEPVADYAVGDHVPEGEVLVPGRGYAGFATVAGGTMIVVVEPRSRTVVLVVPRKTDDGRLIPAAPPPLAQIRSPGRGT